MICEHGIYVTKNNDFCPVCRIAQKGYYTHFEKGMKTWR